VVFVDRPAVGISPDAEELGRKAVRVLITRIDGATPDEPDGVARAPVIARGTGEIAP